MIPVTISQVYITVLDEVLVASSVQYQLLCQNHGRETNRTTHLHGNGTAISGQYCSFEHQDFLRARLIYL